MPELRDGSERVPYVPYMCEVFDSVDAISTWLRCRQSRRFHFSKRLIGERGADTVQTLLKNAQKPASGVFASLVAFVMLLFGASGVFLGSKA